MNTHKAKKSLGQNFLIDQNYQQKIASAVFKNYADLPIIEIGPGQGAISKHLVTQASHLFLIEKDHALVENLRQEFQACPNVTVIGSDFMDLDLENLLQGKSKALVVGNLPYNVSTQILIKLFEHHEYFQSLFLMFQKEVAIRCQAQPDCKDYSMLTIWVQLYAEAKRLFDLPPTVFRPQPKVTSSFMQFDLKPSVYPQANSLIKFCKALFAQRRKKISSVLRHQEAYALKIQDLILDEQGKVWMDSRIEDLSLQKICELFERLSVSA